MTLNGTLRGWQINALTTEYLVLLTPSVIGSFSVLVVSIVRWRHLNEQVHLLVQLALADLLAALILMCTSAMNKVSVKYSVEICQYSLPLSLTFYFISFLLVVVYAWKSKSAIQGWRARPLGDEAGQSLCRRTITNLPVYALVWVNGVSVSATPPPYYLFLHYVTSARGLIPISMYLAYVLTPFIKSALVIPSSDTSLSGTVPNIGKYCNSCILFLHFWRDSCSDDEKKHDITMRSFLFIVVISVLLACSFIYYKVGKWYERYEQEGLFPVEGDGRSRKRFKRVLSTARNMMMVILFCWAPVLVLILLSYLMYSTKVEQHNLFVLYIIQAASVSLQGFLNSMVYAWRRPNFTEAVLGENTPLVGYNRLAFFDESLRSSSC